MKSYEIYEEMISADPSIVIRGTLLSIAHYLDGLEPKDVRNFLQELQNVCEVVVEKIR